MPTIARDKECFYLSNIRQLLAIDPDMSVREMQRQLADNGIDLHRDYLTKLVRKHYKSLVYRFDRQTADKAVAHSIDVLAETTHRIWPILLSKTSTNMEKIAAAKEIRESHMTAFKLIQLAGIFEWPKPSAPEINKMSEAESETVEKLVADLRAMWGYPPKSISEILAAETPEPPKPITPPDE
jgi:hypothetical protein